MHWLVLKLQGVLVICIFFLMVGRPPFAFAIPDEDVWTIAEKKSVLPPGAREEGLVGIMESFGPPIKKIIMISVNPYMGDTLTTVFPYIESFHQRFPDAKIEVVSPQHYAIRPNAWLSAKPPPFPIEKKLLSKLKALPSNEWNKYLKKLPGLSKLRSFIHEQSAPDTLFFINLCNLDAWIGAQSGEPGRGEDAARTLSKLLEETITKENARFIFRPEDTSMFSELHFWRIYAGIEDATRAREFLKFWADNQTDLAINHRDMGKKRQNTMYDSTQKNGSLLFGTGFTYTMPSDYFFPEMASELEFRKKVTSRFKDPSRPFVLINLDTSKDLYKHLLAKNPNLVQEIATHILRNTEMNVLIVSVEKPGTSWTATEAGEIEYLKISKKEWAIRTRNLKNFVKQHADRMSLLPMPKKDLQHTNYALQEARLVVSVDTGMVHIANILNEPKNVISFSPEKLIERWVAEGQPYTITKNGESKPILDKITEVLQRDSLFSIPDCIESEL